MFQYFQFPAETLASRPQHARQMLVWNAFDDGDTLFLGDPSGGNRVNPVMLGAVLRFGQTIQAGVSQA